MTVKMVCMCAYRKTSSKHSRRLLEHGPQNPGF